MPEVPFRSGYIAVVGKPNVGKSTLINMFLGQKVAAVSPRPQTTRQRQLGILTLDRAQLIFMDTPGLHFARHKLGELMNAVAVESLQDADVIVFVVDASQPPDGEDRLVAEKITSLKPCPPLILALNKIDLLAETDRESRQAEYQALSPEAYCLSISCFTGQGRDPLLEALIERLSTGEPLFDEDQVTDIYEREIAADLVREAALNYLRDEVPHALAVRIDEYAERGSGAAYIAATMFVERESQKPIVIGQGGAMLKKIGTAARKEIEAMSGRKIFLELRVKVQKNWRNNGEALHRFGFSKKED
ncbi:MAG: GTPase Era [Chloroflexi bacterium]|nr:GTPase Era [Chloroflexota bacterium]